MNRYTSIGIAILVLGIFTVIGIIASAQDQGDTKLDIIPQYGNIRLQPGESKEIMVTVKNNENQPVSIKPNITTSSYDTSIIETDWVAIEPTTADIPAGESVRFIINVSVPKDAAIGNSNVQIAFTDAHIFQLSVDIWKPSNLQISMPYINDQLEAGKVYDYEINVKNVGNSAVEISPILVNDMYYGPYGTTTPILTDKSIIITAPDSIPAGSIETINVRVDVPADVRGYYNGYIDLRPDTSGDAKIMLAFNVWKQPTEPFVNIFSIGNLAPITIEISSYYNSYPYLITKREEPSFDTNIVGPNGDVELDITKTVIKGNVNMASDISWGIGNMAEYQEMGTQHIVTYRTRTDGSPGEWKLDILPHNTPGFDYSITIGE